MSEKECVVCMETKPARLLVCNHEFCYDCIVKWSRVSMTCPLCRTEMQYKVNLTSDKCQGVIKNGRRAGLQCRNNPATNNGGFCYVHRKRSVPHLLLQQNLASEELDAEDFELRPEQHETPRWASHVYQWGRSVLLRLFYM
jgi:hypothetical protein